ncbi:MAG: polysaccharide biosynthesis/export family protein [Dysgonomonas sp.]
MKSKLFLLTSFFFTFLFTSCVTSKQTNLLQDIKKNYPTQEAPEDYKIIQGDQLRIAIYTFDESMKTLFPMYVSSTILPNDNNVNTDMGGSNNILNVYSDGTIKIPYLGKISVEGLTVVEAKKIIAARFNTFSQDLTVDVVLNNRSFSFLGEFGYGKIQMEKQRINIFQALSKVGNFSESGNRKQVYIIRQLPGGATQYKQFDLRSKDIIDSEYYFIQPNDVIYMPKINSTFFGRISGFNDIFSTFGIVTSSFATVMAVINLTK